MKKKPEQIFFDSNLYINLLRNPEYARRLKILMHGAYLFVINKIVLMELWAGGQRKGEENILKLFQEELPVIGIDDCNFIAAGQILSRMKSNQIESKMRRRLTWDILVALSAKENNAVVVTGEKSARGNILGSRYESIWRRKSLNFQPWNAKQSWAPEILSNQSPLHRTPI